MPSANLKSARDRSTKTYQSSLAYAFIGIGVGLAGTPRLALTHRLGPGEAGRDGLGNRRLAAYLGGAILQSIIGAFLAAGYAGAAVAASGKSINESVQSELTKALSSAADAAEQYPSSVKDSIIAGAKTSFLQGDQWAPPNQRRPEDGEAEGDGSRPQRTYVATLHANRDRRHWGTR
jgi:MFS transporter, DHA2 family, multidrug resistance protein